MKNLHSAPGASVRGLALLAILLASGTLGVRFDAQAGEQGQDEEKRIELRKMRELVEGFKVYKVGKKRVPVRLIADPLMRFTDAVDRNQDGSLWVWGRTGRPSAVMQLWRDLPDGRDWFHSITSLSSALVVAEQKSGLRWSPRKPGVTLKRFSKSPAPATRKAAKLRQMKELARRFTAHEVLSNGQRFELRLLARPIHSYSDPKSGPIDGVVFVLVRGTDPEIALLIEIAAEDSSPAAWQYGLASISSAELHVNLDGREVWRTTPGDGRPTDVYWLYWQPVK